MNPIGPFFAGRLAGGTVRSLGAGVLGMLLLQPGGFPPVYLVTNGRVRPGAVATVVEVGRRMATTCLLTAAGGTLLAAPAPGGKRLWVGRNIWHGRRSVGASVIEISPYGDKVYKSWRLPLMLLAQYHLAACQYPMQVGPDGTIWFVNCDSADARGPTADKIWAFGPRRGASRGVFTLLAAVGPAMLGLYPVRGGALVVPPAVGAPLYFLRAGGRVHIVRTPRNYRGTPGYLAQTGRRGIITGFSGIGGWFYKIRPPTAHKPWRLNERIIPQVALRGVEGYGVFPGRVGVAMCFSRRSKRDVVLCYVNGNTGHVLRMLRVHFPAVGMRVFGDAAYLVRRSGAILRINQAGKQTRLGHSLLAMVGLVP